MAASNNARVCDLAELLLAVTRHIKPPSELVGEMCTAVESTVMRFISQHPGTTAGAASEATLLPSSNFSRVVRALEKNELIRREVDPLDARTAHFYATDKAKVNLAKLRSAWGETLRGTIDSTETLEILVSALREMENELVKRAQSAGVTNRRAVL